MSRSPRSVSCLVASQCLLWLLTAGTLAAEAVPSVTVGMPGRLTDLLLPGSELQARPLDDRKLPIVVRILRADPVAKGFRYDLEFIGLQAGSYDLREYLVRGDRSPAKDLPPIPVRIDSVLPQGQQLPNDLQPAQTPRPGGYRLVLWVAGLVWVAGLLAILLLGRRRRRQSAVERAGPSLADRLRPLVEDALAGRAATGQLAELERALIGYWSRRLSLEELKPAVALTRLRQHPEAGPLLVQLERWLHQPGKQERVEIAALLEPYRRLRPDALEKPA